MISKSKLILLLITVVLLLLPHSAEKSSYAENTGQHKPWGMLGSKIDSFTLDDYLGAKHSLSDWKKKKAIVVVFLGTECPLAKLYGQRLTEMAAKYEPQGVQFVGINANRQDTLIEMGHYARIHKIDFPLLKDPGCKVADLFGATRTPEAFLLDQNHKICYRGRIDDQYGVGYSRSAPTTHELANALDSLLAGSLIEIPVTTAVGCFIGRAAEIEPHGDITYCNQVSRVIQKHCIECHREEQIAPFALSDYEEVSAWSDTILEVVNDGRMPPWHANPEHGDFLNDARMTVEEKELLIQWVENGMPEGDVADLPEPAKFAEGWRIPQPDVIYKMSEEFNVPAKGTVPYKHFVIDPGFTEDMWVVASEARPGNRAVVHHMILFYIPPGQESFKSEDALFNMITAFAPGMPAIQFNKNLAMRIPAGSKLGFQLHYTPNGSPQTDLSEVGLIFADRSEVEKEIFTRVGVNWKIKIPPREENYRIDANYHVRQDSLIYSFSPHMHYRGKSFRFTARYPDGLSETLLDVPYYDFNWQNVYLLAKPKFLPMGTRVHLEAVFDNSSKNLLNPDPTATVTWGDQTWQEMMLGTMMLSQAEQNLYLGPPKVEKIEENKYLVRFRYRASEPVDSVYLAGEFNNWKQTEHLLKGPDESGDYYTTLELPSGDHEYKFVLNGSVWKSDPGNHQQIGIHGNSVIHLK